METRYQAYLPIAFNHQSVATRAISYLREPFINVVDAYRGIIPSMNNGLVDARQAHRILGEGYSFDLWLYVLTTDFPMRFGIDYFSETPIPDWNWSMPTPPSPMEGPVLFTACLIEEIAAEPVYERDYYDFDVHRQWLQSLKSGTTNPQPTH